MLSKINKNSIISSFWIGLAISLVFQKLLNISANPANLMTIAFIGGAIGILIGTVTEVITVFLPISMANPKMYFIISGSIGVLITFMVLSVTKLGLQYSFSPSELRIAVVVSVGIIAVANGFEYLNYKRTNIKLEAYKKQLENQ